MSCNFEKNMNYSPEVQGHRGCRGLMPENTIEGFIAAIDIGVNTLEMDVVITQDSQVILSHEPFFNHEISMTSDGIEITKEKELEYNIFRMNTDPRFPDQQKIKTFKPTLIQVFDAIEKYLKENNLPAVDYNIEIKRVSGYNNNYHPDAETFARLVLETIEQNNLIDRTIIQSFDLESLRQVKSQNPNIRIALLNEKTVSYERIIAELGFKPDIYSPHFKLVSEQLSDYCRKENIRLIPWTVNEKTDIQDMLDRKVDGIISDYPDRVIELTNAKKSS